MTGATDDRGSLPDRPGDTAGAAADGDPLDRTVISTTPGDIPERDASGYGAAREARNRRKRVAGTLLGVLVVGAVVGGIVVLDASDESSSRSGNSAAPATTEAPAPTLPPAIGLASQVVLGELEPLTAGAGGTVSSIGAVGDVVERGAVVGLVDAQPVVLFYGSEAFARELRLGDSGGDVRQLEANLSALGFDDGGAMSVDLEFTSETAAAVAAWEDSVGVARSGVVPAGRLTVAAGPVRIAEAVAPGTAIAAGEPLARVILLSRIDDVVQDGSGVVSGPLSTGTAIVHGDTLHLLGEWPVLAVSERNDFVSSVLDPLAAGDIAGVESALVFFGYDPDRVVVIDSVADLATLAAFARWQTAMGLPETLALGSQYYVDVPAGSRVCRTHLVDGQVVEGGALAYTVVRPTVRVEALVPVEQEERFAVGEVVMVEVSDGVVERAVVVRAGDDAAAEVANTGDGDDADDAAADASMIPVVLVVFDASATVLGGPATILPDAEVPAARDDAPDDAPDDLAGDAAPASCSIVEP
jgi:peptidoglycan hydrolase-like protein with peptidoglycan-binding domain